MIDEQQKKLAELRREIDEIDHRFLDKFADLWRTFLTERSKAVKKIGEYKESAGLGPIDTKREQEVISDRANKGYNKTGLPRQLLEKIWEFILAETK